MLYLRTRLLHISGQEISSELPIAWDPHSSPQALGSAITYARRYALCALLNIAAEEDDDAQAASAAAPAPAGKPKAPPKPKPAGSTASAPKAAPPSSAPSSSSRSKPAGSSEPTISAAQQKRLWAIATDAAGRLDLPRAAVETYIRDWISDLGLEGTSDLTKKPYENLCARLEELRLNDLVPKHSRAADAHAAPDAAEPF